MFEIDTHRDLPPGAGDSAPVPSERRNGLRDWPRGWAPDVFLLALAAVVCALTSVRVGQRIATGPSWDTYAFLDNAADMAGKSVGYVEPHRPPLMSFLTSLMLRAGAWDVSTIQVLDGALTVVGVVAFYLLARRRFERPLAMVASALLLLVPPLWTWLGSGYTDFPSVALSICAVLLVVMATEDDPRWYWIALPMVLFAILTRFGAFLMLFPVGLWIALRARPFAQARDIMTGLGLAALSYVPAGVYYHKYFGDPFFPFTFAGSVAGTGLAGASARGAVPTGLSAIPGWYFVKNLTQLLLNSPSNTARTLFLVLTVTGLVATVVVSAARQPRRLRSLLPVAAVVLVVLTEVRGGAIARVAAIAILGFVIATVVRPRESSAERSSTGEMMRRGFSKLDPKAALALDATLLVWGLLFLDAHGHMKPQIDRYFITMAPAAMYFLAMGWRTLGIPLTLLTEIRLKDFEPGHMSWSPRLNPASQMACLVGVIGLGAVVTIGAAGAVRPHVAAKSPTVASAQKTTKVTSKAKPASKNKALADVRSPSSRELRDPIIRGAEESAKWLLAHDSQIHGKTVYSDVWPLTSWYLGSEAFPMPTFESAKAFPHELEKNRVDYFITIRARRYPGYVPVYGAASTTVLKHDTTFPRALPAIAYIGDGWDAYLEQLCNFDFSLYFSNRRQVGLGTWMLDGLSAAELARYDAVAVFGAHWRNKGAAEKALRTYVEGGGVVIMDASHNMDGFSYPLVDTVFMDVLVRRKQVSPSVVMTVSPTLADESHVATSFAPTPFVGERGGPWFGANYDPAVWARGIGQDPERFEVLASIGSEPAILLERIGKGRIYWVSNNLMWHAYLEGNENEVRLVRGLFREAAGLPPTPAAEVATNVKPWFVSRKLRPVRAAASRGKSAATSSNKVSVLATGSGVPLPKRDVSR